MFSSPIGESTFSTERKIYEGCKYSEFSSPIGESTFSTETSGMCYLLAMLFSSPIGESTFSTKINIHRGDSWNVFVPYRGIYFLYLFMQKHLTIKVLRVFVPYRGIYFLYKDESTFEDDEPVFSSPIGESTFSTRKAFGCIHPAGMGFSSPIGESTFSTSKLDENEWALLEVFVPYRGIYFLYLKIPARLRCRNMGFSSPIGESTFSTG